MTLNIRKLSCQSPVFTTIKQWREQYIGDNPAGEPEYHYWETIRDEFSYSFAFYQAEELVGGVRLTPLGHGITMGERQLDLVQFIPAPMKTLEVNRLVIDERVRGKRIMHDALQHCFRWALENTTHTQLIAFCLPRMVPLYRRVGAEVLQGNIQCKYIPTKYYSLINLNLKDL